MNADLITTILTGCLVVACLLILISIVLYSWRNGISPMPSPIESRAVVATELQRLGQYGTLLEAGSGWGSLVFYLARACPGWRITGVENSMVPYVYARLRLGVVSFLLSRGLLPCQGHSLGKRLVFRRADLYKWPLEQTDVIVCYLYPAAMQRLSSLLHERLLPGATIISVCFALPDWQPERVIVCKDIQRTKVYVYRVE